MRANIIFAVLVVAFSSLTVAPATAQFDEFDAAVSACSEPPVDTAACDAAIETYIAAVDGLPIAARDDALADLVVALSAVAAPETRDNIASAILILATAMTDGTRAAAAVAVAQDVSAGLSPDTEIVSVLASPN